MDGRTDIAKTGYPLFFDAASSKRGITNTKSVNFRTCIKDYLKIIYYRLYDTKLDIQSIMNTDIGGRFTQWDTGHSSALCQLFVTAMMIGYCLLDLIYKMLLKRKKEFILFYSHELYHIKVPVCLIFSQF